MNDEVKKDSNLNTEEIHENNKIESEKTALETPTIEQTNTAKVNPLNNIFNKLKKFGLSKVIAIAAVIVVLVALIIVKTALSTPKQAFKNAINELYKETSRYLNDADDFLNKYNLEKETVINNVEFKIDSNIEDFNSSLEETGINIKDTTIKAKVGYNLDKEELVFGGSLKGESEEISLDAYAIDDNVYIKTNLYDDIIKAENSYGSPFANIDELKEYNKIMKNLDFKTYDSILKSITNALNNSLNSDDMEKESDEIDIVDSSVKVTKNSYELDDKALSNIIRDTIEQLLDDKDFIDNLADTLDIKKDDLEDSLKDLRKSAKDIEYDEKLVINIYTKGLLNSFTGLSLEIERDEYFTYFTDGKNTEITFDNNQEGYSETKINIQAVKDGKETDVTVKYNGEEIITATIKELSEEKVDLDFELKEDKETVASGTIYLTVKEEKDNVSGDFELHFEQDKEYLNLKGNYKTEIGGKLTTIDPEKAIDENEIDESVLMANLEEIAKKDKVLSSLYDNYYESTLDLNYYEMAVVYGTDELKEILSRKQGTVLYVGSTGRTYGTGADTAIFDNLEKAQEEYNFHTYYFSQYYINDEFRSLVSGVTPICNANPENNTTNTCTEYPTVYFIKDGKIVAAVQNTITKDELTKYLQEIGIA